MSQVTAAIWFRRDFRLQDNTALFHVLSSVSKNNTKWIAFFHLDDPIVNNRSLSLHHDYFFQTLIQFKDRLKNLGIQLHIITGGIEQAFEKLINRYPALSEVYVNQDLVGEGMKRDQFVKKNYSDLRFHFFEDSFITHPLQVLKPDGNPYKVFTPYYRAWSKVKKAPPLRLDESILSLYSTNDDVVDDDGELKLHQLKNLCSQSFDRIGENHALERLEHFLKVLLLNYKAHRDQPALMGTSRLSPYLKVGALSARTILYTALERQDSEGRETLIKELAWRDFYYMVYYFNPESKQREVSEQYRSINWKQNIELLENWKRGETGFPLIDAGMRQLQKEGWMHNRLRMATASFLTKDYLIDWRLGEAYFAEMLIDYEPSSNIGGWQWAASVGTDPVPYFRVFNPVTQSRRFDEDGRFIRKYVSELKHVPTKYIHEPWKMPLDVQVESACVIGETYPYPSVDHKSQRLKAIELFKNV